MKDNYFRVHTQRLAAFFILNKMYIKNVVIENRRFVFLFENDVDKIDSIMREYKLLTGNITLS